MATNSSIQSEMPDADDAWRASDWECPTCGKLMWASDWWDDTLEAGGACIGTWYQCGDCGDYETG
jgi:hypothetical protein